LTSRRKRILFCASAAFAAFGLYVLFGGMSIMWLGVGHGIEPKPDRPVESWLWWVGGTCAVAGVTGLCWLHLEFAIRPEPFRHWKRVAQVGFVTLAMVLPVVGSFLVYEAGSRSDLRDRSWKLLVLVVVTYVLMGLVHFLVRHWRPPDSR
jgi:hypothetical protein